ncbi:MAG: hypothetical protein QUV05_07760 [Phycisphaerae bacterium]|nr:hypothetical protein [Phycisphaerae bacterium]
MRPHTLHSAVVLLWTAVPVVVATRAFAGPDGGVFFQQDSAIFSGNQVDGIRAGEDFDCPPVLNLYVRDLTSVIDLDRDDFSGLSVAGVGLPYIAANGENHTLYLNGGNGGWAENLFIDFDAGAWLLPGDEYGFLRTGQFEWSPGITARSKGGDGGRGGGAYLFGPAGHGGFGRPGGDVTIRVNVRNSSGPHLMTRKDYSYGIWALSEGGKGGNGGDAWGIYVIGGDGGPGGDGGLVAVDASAWIQTAGLESYGILAQSLGGANGVPGAAGGIVAGGGDAGSTGAGRDVNVTSSKYIETRGKDSDGILAQSIGGFARGAGGAGGLIYVWGGSGASSGDGGLITVNNTGPIRTKESGSSAIIGQSIGGGGGRACLLYTSDAADEFRTV